MNDLLEFGDESWDEAKGLIFSTVKRVHNDIYGNGKPGIKADMEEVKQTLIKIETFASATAFWGKVVAGLLALLIAGGTFYVAYFEAHHHISAVQSSQTHTLADGK